MDEEAKPRLVCLPQRDRGFVRHVEALLASGMSEPADLEATARAAYAEIAVHPSELSGLPRPIWYVYCNGSFVSSQ
jgi:hypothetical protein